MAQWKNTDASGNSVLWAPAKYNLAPNTTNRDNLFDNSTANAFVKNMKIGMFGVSANEVQEDRNIPHTGWVIREEGTGGRAGRVRYEVLVAGGISGDASDDVLFPDYSLHFLTQPQAGGGSVLGNGVATFGVSTYSIPPGATIAYLWEYSANGNVWANASTSGMTGYQTANLSINANTVANGFVRTTISTTGAANVVSNNATYTTTA